MGPLAVLQGRTALAGELAQRDNGNLVVAISRAAAPRRREAAGVRTVVPKEILFEIDLVPGTWYLGKDLRLENHHTSPAVLNDLMSGEIE